MRGFDVASASARPEPRKRERAWLVRGWLPSGDGCEFTFADEAEYRRFMAEKPAHFDVIDIHEMTISGCDRALEVLADPNGQQRVKA